MNEGCVYQKSSDRWKKRNQNIKFDLVRTADLKKTFSKGYTTNWSYKKYKITEVVTDPIPSYKINQLPERYNQASLKKD